VNLNSSHVKALLKVKKLKKELLLGGQITEDDFRNYELLTGEMKELATAEVMYVMHHGFADSICYYSNPVEQGIDPIVIYGERGIYLVHERDNEEFTFFTNRKKAEKYANTAFDTWLEIYGEEV
jgi:hypothetical protein